MRKLVGILLVTCLCCGLVVGCGKESADSNQNEVILQDTLEEDTQDETVVQDDSWKDEIIEEAVDTNFVEIAKGNWEGKHVKATGEINAVDNEAQVTLLDSFCISAVEGEGYGAYFCTNVTDREDLKDGDVITIYGTVEKKDNPYGLDNISVYIIE